MTQSKLMNLMRKLTKLKDFLIIINKKYNSKHWALYYPEFKTIVIYSLDESGEVIDDDLMIAITCHEMAHHIQFYHTENYKPIDGKEHDKKFRKIFVELLNKYYNNNIPERIREEVKSWDNQLLEEEVI